MVTRSAAPSSSVISRETLSDISTLVLAAIAMATIFGHALVVGQRPRATASAPIPPAPSGRIRTSIETGPGLTGLLVYAGLAVGASWEVLA